MLVFIRKKKFLTNYQYILKNLPVSLIKVIRIGIYLFKFIGFTVKLVLLTQVYKVVKLYNF